MAQRDSTGRPVLSATEARQGFRDRPVLLVLTVSVALVCIIFAAIYFHYWP
jgi:hypothetical protein